MDTEAFKNAIAKGVSPEQIMNYIQRKPDQCVKFMGSKYCSSDASEAIDNAKDKIVETANKVTAYASEVKDDLADKVDTAVMKTKLAVGMTPIVSNKVELPNKAGTSEDVNTIPDTAGTSEDVNTIPDTIPSSVENAQGKPIAFNLTQPTRNEQLSFIAKAKSLLNDYVFQPDKGEGIIWKSGVQFDIDGLDIKAIKKSDIQDGEVQSPTGRKIKISQQTHDAAYANVRRRVADALMKVTTDYRDAIEVGLEPDEIVTKMHEISGYITQSVAEANHIPDKVYKAYLKTMPESSSSRAFDNKYFNKALKSDVAVADAVDSTSGVYMGRSTYAQAVAKLKEQRIKDPKLIVQLTGDLPDYPTAVEKGLTPKEAIDFFTGFNGKLISEGQAKLLAIPEKIWHYHNEQVWKHTDHTAYESTTHAMRESLRWLVDNGKSAWKHPMLFAFYHHLETAFSDNKQGKMVETKTLRLYPNTKTAYNTRTPYIDVQVPDGKWTESNKLKFIIDAEQSRLAHKTDWQGLLDAGIPADVVDYIYNEKMLQSLTPHKVGDELSYALFDPIDIGMAFMGAVYAGKKYAQYGLSHTLVKDISTASKEELIQLRNDLNIIRSLDVPDALGGVVNKDPLAAVSNMFDEYKLIEAGGSTARAALNDFVQKVAKNPNADVNVKELERLAKLVQANIQREKTIAYHAAYTAADTVQHDTRPYQESVLRWLNGQAPLEGDTIARDVIREIGAAGNFQIKNSTFNQIVREVRTKGLQLTPAQKVHMKNLRNAEKAVEHTERDIRVITDRIQAGNNYNAFIASWNRGHVNLPQHLTTRQRNIINRALGDMHGYTDMLEKAMSLYTTASGSLTLSEQYLKRLYARALGVGKEGLESLAKLRRTLPTAQHRLSNYRAVVDTIVPNAGTMTEGEMFNLIKRFNEEIYGKLVPIKADKTVEQVYKRIKIFSENYFRRLTRRADGSISEANVLFANASSIARQQFELFGYHAAKGNTFDVAELGKLVAGNYKKIDDLEETIVKNRYKLQRVVEVLSDPRHYRRGKDAELGKLVGKQLAYRWVRRRISRIDTTMAGAGTRTLLELPEASNSIQNIFKSPDDVAFVKKYLGADTYRNLRSIDNVANILNKSLAGLPKLRKHELADGWLSYIFAGKGDQDILTATTLVLPRAAKTAYHALLSLRDKVIQSIPMVKHINRDLKLPVIGVHPQYYTNKAIGDVEWALTKKSVGAKMDELHPLSPNKLMRDTIESYERASRDLSSTTAVNTITKPQAVVETARAVLGKVKDVKKVVQDALTLRLDTKEIKRVFTTFDLTFNKRKVIEGKIDKLLNKIGSQSGKALSFDVFQPTARLKELAELLGNREYKLSGMSQRFIREYNRELENSIKNSTYRKYMKAIWKSEKDLEKVTTDLGDIMAKYTGKNKPHNPKSHRRRAIGLNILYYGGLVYSIYAVKYGTREEYNKLADEYRAGEYNSDKAKRETESLSDVVSDITPNMSHKARMPIEAMQMLQKPKVGKNYVKLIREAMAKGDSERAVELYKEMSKGGM